MSPRARRSRDRRLVSTQASVERRQKPRRQPDERRATVRVPMDLWMEEVRGDEIYFRRSCNISEGGVFFEQSVPHPVGTQVTLRFALPGLAQEIIAHGRVVSAARAHDGLGMGIKFNELEGDAVTVLRQYIAQIKEKRGTV